MNQWMPTNRFAVENAMEENRKPTGSHSSSFAFGAMREKMNGYSTVNCFRVPEIKVGSIVK